MNIYLFVLKKTPFFFTCILKVDRYTQYGYVRGTSYNIESRDSFYPKYISVFLGIPYARPPRKYT